MRPTPRYRRDLGPLKGPPLPESEDEQRAALERYRVGPWDIDSGIDQMLGRDPEQHRPPRLSWENLIRALGNEGIAVSEDDLIAAPLTVEFAPAVKSPFDQATDGVLLTRVI